MNLYSTNDPANIVEFKEAVFNSLPQDGGLYMPVVIPQLDQEFIDNLATYSLQEIAYKVASALLQDAIPSSDLKGIIDDAINFPAPVVKLQDGSYVLELFHGPSLAFKDFGARFMSRVMGYFLREGDITAGSSLRGKKQELNVLVATSGDTGGAVALGFLGVENTKVTILYPKGKVSPIQELQLTTNGQNIRAIEVDGTFDDCQALVKQAFVDAELNEKFRLTSANSINIARLIPQTFYYFNAYAQLLREGKKDIVFSVPSGNFGNIGAGILAYKLGLPVKHFLAATNANDTVPQFLETGVYQPKPSVQTWANAMDVGNPSNWVRIMDMFGNDTSELKKILTGYSYSDDETVYAIQYIFKKDNYVACPHTAIAWMAAQDWKEKNPGDEVVFLSTAHPCKFPEVFPEEIARVVEIPAQVKELEGRPKQAALLDKRFETFKKYLLEAQ